MPLPTPTWLRSCWRALQSCWGPPKRLLPLDEDTTDLLDTLEATGHRKILDAHGITLSHLNYREIWSTVIETTLPTVSFSNNKRLLESAPRHIRCDRDLMMKFCLNAHYFYLTCIDISLLADDIFLAHLVLESSRIWRVHVSQIVNVLINHVWTLLRTSDDEVTRSLSRELAKNCFPMIATFAEEYPFFSASVASTLHNLWGTHRDVTMAYFRAGLPFENGHYTHSMLKGDKEVFLVLAECNSPFRKMPDSEDDDPLRFCSKELLLDADFAMKLVEKDPSLYFSKFFLLSDDPDIAIQVIASLPVETRHWRWRVPFLLELEKMLQKERDQQRAYLRVVKWGEAKFYHFDVHLQGEIKGFLEFSSEDRQQAHHKVTTLLAVLQEETTTCAATAARDE